MLNDFRYEQSKVYQYLTKGDIDYNLLIERKQTILNQQKLAYKDYLMRREKYCNEKPFHTSIVSIFNILFHDIIN